MKKLIIIAILLTEFVSYPNSINAKDISISEAVKNKWITVKVKSTSGHTGECLSMKITNLLNKKINILVEAGRIFIPSDSNVQNLIIVRHENIELERNQTKSTNLNALCAQKHDASPSLDLSFRTGGFGMAGSRQFAEWVDEKAYINNSNTQNAMWVFTDNASPSFTIQSEHDKEMLAFVAKAKNLNYEKLLASFTSNERNNSIPTRPNYMFNSTLTFVVSSPQILKILLTDINNTIVKECIANDTLKVGENLKRVEITNENLTNGKYYLKIFIDGKMIKRREIVFR